MTLAADPRLRKSAEERRAEVVSAALDLADRVGPERLSTQAVADAVGISQAAIFRHFPRKQDIWNAVVAWMGEQLERRWEGAACGASGSARAAIEATLVGHLDLVGRVPGIPAILLSRELHSRNEMLRQGLSALLGRFQARLERLVAEGVATGEFRRDLDVPAAALLLVGIVQSVVLRWSLGGRRLDLPAEGRRLLAVLMRGFLTEVRS